MLKKSKALAVLLVSLVLVLTGCAPKKAAETPVPPAATEPTYQKFTHNFFDTFDTMITVMAYTQDEATFNEFAQKTESLFQKYHQLYDGYNAYPGINNLYTINQEAKNAPVKIDDELYRLLAFCKEHQPKMQGQVNVALGSVLKIWHNARDFSIENPEKAFLPDLDALQKAALHTDFDKVVLDENESTVHFLDPALQLDLGAVAKGYAVQEIANILLEGNVQHFLINAGGNVYAAKPPLDGRDNWGIAIQDPGSMEAGQPSGLPQLILQLHDWAVVTSGDYQRYYTVNGQRYHHLIDPDTLFPSNHMRSVSVIAKDSGLGDLLSTALFLMPVDEGLAFLKQFPDVHALFILNDLSIKATPGIENYLLNADIILNGQNQ